MQGKHMPEGLVSSTAKPGMAARAGLVLTALLCVGLGAPSCSFIVDKNSHQCESNADCANAGLGDTCTAEFVCTTVNTVTGCTKNSDCTVNDAQSICRKSDKTCVKVITPECTTIYPANAKFSHDNPFIIGSIFPTTGDYALLGKPLENGIKLALRDFDKNTNGLPPVGSGDTRPFILIGCDDQLDDARATSAANHLAKDLELPAIIGAAYSGTTIKVFTEIAKGAGTLMISPGATSDAITSLPDNNLLWRTAPPDSLQSKALTAYGSAVEQRVRTKLNLMAGDKIKVAIVSNDDTYGVGLGDGLQSELQINGAPALDASNDPYYKRFQYTFESGSYAMAVNNVLSFEPHIVFFIAFNEGVSDIMVPVEAQWTNGTYKPEYIFSDGALVQELADAVKNDPTLNTRISGTVPGTTSPLFAQFKTSYTTEFTDLAVEGDPATFGAAGAYDAAYLLAFATATLAGKPETGGGLATGLTKMSSGTFIKVGNSADINKAFTTLSTGATIDFDGASGSLQFDPKTGEAPSDYLIWCVSNVNMNVKIGEYTGQFFNFATNKIEGTLDQMKCPLGT